MRRSYESRLISSTKNQKKKKKGGRGAGRGNAVSQRGKCTNLVVVSQQLVKEVDGFVANEALVLRVHKAVPGLLLESAKDVVVLGVELYLVLVQVVKKVVGAQDLGNLDQLVRVAVAMEKWLLAEDHGGKHSAKAPHVEAVVVLLKVDEQLRAFEVAGRNLEKLNCQPPGTVEREDGAAADGI